MVAGIAQDQSSDDSPWHTFMKGNCPTKEEIQEFLNIMGV